MLEIKINEAENAARILAALGYGENDLKLVKIAGFMHDIGNAINRKNHGEYGGILANEILRNYDLPMQDRITIISAISNHDESTGRAVDPISAALILADKTDVRRNRVRNQVKETFDKHDQVNYAAKSSRLSIDMVKKTITLDIELDEEMCSMMDYFEIFLQRMLMCRRAAEMLGLRFRLVANENKIC